MLKKSLFVSGLLIGLTFSSQSLDDIGQVDADTLANTLRECGLEGQELNDHFVALLGLEPIPAEVDERIVGSSSSVDESKKEINTLKVHDTFHGDVKILNPHENIYRQYFRSEEEVKFTVQSSSARNNNCFFYSIIGDNLELLTKVLKGDENLAKMILEDSESKGRKFTKVRRAFFRAIRDNLPKVVYLKDGATQTIEELLRSIIGGDQDLREDYKRKGEDFDSHKISISRYLSNLSKQDSLLDDTYAVIFSCIYDLSVHVLTPSTMAGHEGTIVEALTPSYYQLPKHKDPIFIFHLGFGGDHYWKLRLSLPKNLGDKTI